MSFEDYYGYPEDQGYNGDDDMSFLLGLFGSPQFSDPGTGMPGDTFANRLSNLKGIEGLLGIPLTQLMGGGSVSQETMAPMPTEGVSYTRQVYGKAPQFADAFAAIDQGVDPQSVYQELLNKAGEYGIKFAPGDTEYQDWADRTFGVINDYAFESVKNRGEYDKAMAAWEGSAQNAGNTFKIGTKTYQGQPDINGMASQHDLMGAPDLQTLLTETALKRQKDNTPNAISHDGVSRPGTTQADVMAAPWRNGVMKDTQEVYEQKQKDYFSGGAANPNRMGDLGKYQARYDKVHLGKALEKSKNTMVRSDANAEAMRKVMALRALLGA